MTAPDEWGNRMPGPFPAIDTGDRRLDAMLTQFLAIKYGDRTDTARYALEKKIARRLEHGRRPADGKALLALLSDQAFDVGKVTPTDELPGTPAVKRARSAAWNTCFGACLIRKDLMTLVLRGALGHRECDARLAELAGKGSVDKEDLLGDAIEESQLRELSLGPALVAALGARLAHCKERGSSDSTVKALLRAPVEKAFDALAPHVRAWSPTRATCR